MVFNVEMRSRTSKRVQTNWAGNQRWKPTAVVRPATTPSVAVQVAKATDAGQRVKAIGAGHSFTAAATTTGTLLVLDRMTAVESVDREKYQVTVQAGITLSALNEALAEVGLAMPNLGDIAYQTISGAIATATHGTGLGLGNLATTVIGMELVSSTGEMIWCDTENNPELLRVARVGIGSLGVVTKVKLQCVPAFNLEVAETVEVLDDLLDGFFEHAESNDHFEFFWMPGARRAHVKRNNRTELPAQPPSKFEYFRDKYVAENLAFGTVCRVGRRYPAAVPKIAKIITSGVSERALIDRSDRVFASPRLVKFYEMEYGLPYEHLPDAFRAVRDFISTLDIPILFPIECRVSAADDIPLSTAQGRRSAWIAVHMYQGTDYEEYFRGVERTLKPFLARPHWGKLHFQNHHQLEKLYPEWSAFQDVRQKLDPTGTFRNDYTDRVLGRL